MAKRMTERVKRGLRHLMANADAGTAADVLGIEPSDHDDISREAQKDWEDVLAAIEWIQSLE